MNSGKCALVGAVAALAGLGCSTTLIARRPLSEAGLRAVNDAVEGHTPTVVLTGDAEAGTSTTSVLRPALPVAPTADAPDRSPQAEPIPPHRFDLLQPDPQEKPRQRLSEVRIHVGPEVTEWLVDGSPRSAPTAALRRISVQKRGVGVVAVAGAGLLVGFSVGGLLGLASGDDQCRDWCIFKFTAGQKALIGGISLGVLGLAAGTIAGIIAGQQTTVEFDPPEPPPAVPKRR
jgi:hypothetical protein